MINSDGVENAVATKVCTTCCNEYPMDQFIGQKQQETKQCLTCRERCKENDKKRS
jgi:hypothetical protein